MTSVMHSFYTAKSANMLAKENMLGINRRQCMVLLFHFVGETHHHFYILFSDYTSCFYTLFSEIIHKWHRPAVSCLRSSSSALSVWRCSMSQSLLRVDTTSARRVSVDTGTTLVTIRVHCVPRNLMQSLSSKPTLHSKRLQIIFEP